jgi:hypothetical protein
LGSISAASILGSESVSTVIGSIISAVGYELISRAVWRLRRSVTSVRAVGYRSTLFFDNARQFVSLRAAVRVRPWEEAPL